MNLSRDEQESHFSQTAQERIDNILHAYSDDEVWIRAVERLGIEGRQVNEFGGMEYEIDLNDYSLSLRKKRKVSDAERKRLAAQLSRSSNAL